MLLALWCLCVRLYLWRTQVLWLFKALSLTWRRDCD